MAGLEAERVAYLFSLTPREPLLAGTYTWVRSLPPRSRAGAQTDGVEEVSASRAELDAVVLLHLANLAEQAWGRDGSPVPWLARLRDIAESLIDSETIALPTFFAQLSSLTGEEEALARRSYLAGLRDDVDPETRMSKLGLAAALCPVLPEPCVWMSYFARRRNDLFGSRAWTSAALSRLAEFGTVWDKRLSFDEWRLLAVSLGEDGHDLLSSPDLIIDPRRLHGESVGAVSKRAVRASAPVHDAVAGAARFQRYVASLSDDDGAALGRVYPELTSLPWYDPHQFPLAVSLESNFPAIREEILALDPSGFHRESEQIRRAGDWDVAFFYERGRRRDELCAACPVTTRVIEAYPAMRTIAGLTYLSRMRGGTHIAAHRGPTNLRLRCHLGIDVPRGDCAIRVGDETRRWEEGRCLVFDDFCEHEAWNYTDQHRIVLIVDLWHPGLSAAEVRLLEGLHGYTYAHARRLGGYWAANAAAARASAED
jgi:aspartate beta-hydroxylase